MGGRSKEAGIASRLGAVGKRGTSMTGYLSESHLQEGEAGMRRKLYMVKKEQSLLLAMRREGFSTLRVEECPVFV